MSDASYVIRPRFGAMVLQFAKLFAFTLGAVWLFGVVSIFFSEHPERTVEFLGWGGLAILVGAPLIGVVLAVLAIPWHCTLTPEGITGRSYIGLRRRIAYRNLGEPYIDNSQGFTLLRMSDLTTGKELVMYPVGLDLREVHSRLARWAGPENPLTRAFEP